LYYRLVQQYMLFNDIRIRERRIQSFYIRRLIGNCA
jgi:hypothetical protein